MTRSSNTEARRAQFAEAMVRVVARVGYERASVQEIAHEAGLAPGLFHYHFARKLDALLAMQTLVLARHAARVDRWLSRATTPRDRVRAFIDCHLARGAEEDPDALACWIALTAEALRESEVRDAWERAVRDVVGRLAGEIDALERDGAAVATALFAAIQGYYALHGAAPGLIPRGSAAPAVHRLADALLDAPSSAPTHPNGHPDASARQPSRAATRRRRTP